MDIDMKKLLTIALVLCTLTSSAQMRGGSQFDPGAVRSNLTNITSGSALSVANGGTGKTTAAEGLAALGGASLNGSSTVDFNTKKIYGATSNQSAPTYSFSNDTNTGIYCNAPDTLGLAAGGVTGLVTSGGNTAMGTDVSVNYKLRLFGSGANIVVLKADLEPAAVTTTEARYLTGIFGSTSKRNISATATDTGYLRGLALDSFIQDGNFQGGLTNQYGAYIRTGINAGTGTITNSYGLYLGLLRTTGTIVNAWGLYQDAATARNYFAGRTLIGTNTDDGVSALQVNGNIKADKTLAADGTAAAPAYSFASDPNTGMYSSAADTVGVSVGGTQIATFTATGLLTQIEMPANVYGVEINLATPSAPTFTRLAGAVGKTPGADFNGINAFGGRRRCNLSDAGVVNKYYGEAGYVEDGSNGQVMVEQPRFYYKVVPLVTVPIGNGIGSHVIRARYYVSDSMLEGFKLHPAFIKDGLERPVIYLSAYEGSIYDTSESAYLLADEQVADFTETTGDTLCSIAGAKPASGLTQLLTRANSRQLAVNRGAKWSLATIQSVSASQLLFLVEYASFNTQATIGRGIVDKGSGTGNESEVTGATTSLGNSSGAAVGTNGLVSITYRGEENFWGNLWKWVDGLNIQASSLHYAWIADKNFADDTATGYVNAGFTLAKANGYVSSFGYSGGFDWLFLPSAVAGSDSNPVGDNFYQISATEGFLVPRLGGNWANGSSTGGYYWYLNCASSDRSRGVGARSLYVP
jgi:hypothetical protein